MSVLALENVSYKYKRSDKNALKDVNCRFEGGTCYSIMGPSGSGKTTLLSIMAGLDRPTSGSVTVDGNDLAGMNPDKYRRENVSIIFRSFQLFPLLTVIENAAYPLELNGTPPKAAKEQAAKLLVSVGIEESLHKRCPANLSGGEQQRVAIVRALASGAAIILADEPTGSLDSENGDKVVGILKSLAKDRGYCVIIVTHDSDVADATDKRFKVRDGVVTEQVRTGGGPSV